jgi:hypothetical protein
MNFYRLEFMSAVFFVEVRQTILSFHRLDHLHRTGIPRIGRAFPPLDRLSFVRNDAIAIGVAITKSVLRSCISRLGRALVPLDRLSFVDSDASANSS